MTRICPECGGSGWVVDHRLQNQPCPDCDGTGEVEIPIIPREDEE